MKHPTFKKMSVKRGNEHLMEVAYDLGWGRDDDIPMNPITMNRRNYQVVDFGMGDHVNNALIFLGTSIIADCLEEISEGGYLTAKDVFKEAMLNCESSLKNLNRHYEGYNPETDGLY